MTYPIRIQTFEDLRKDDFERCTPLEFTKILQAANEKTEVAIKLGWE